MSQNFWFTYVMPAPRVRRRDDGGLIERVVDVREVLRAVPEIRQQTTLAPQQEGGQGGQGHGGNERRRSVWSGF